MSYRIGIGYDIHRLVSGRKLFLGGVEVHFPKGLLGHSDGDALLHALCDALLGAVSLGDIGDHFPDTDPKYKSIKSCELLKKVYTLIKGKGFGIENVDVVIIAQQPKLTAYKEKIKRRIAAMLNIKSGDVGIKAKTNEGFGEIGKAKAIAAYAVCLVRKTDRRR